MMFARRLADEPSDWSDVSEHAGSRRGSTVADTDGNTTLDALALLRPF